MILRNLLIGMLMAAGLDGWSQIQTSPTTSFTTVAKATRANDGTLRVEANSPRPLWQTFESVRRQYGWTVDYEDPIYTSESVMSDAAHGIYPRGGAFTASIKEPANNSLQEEKRVLQGIVNQYNVASSIKYRVIQVSGIRFDISPAVNSPLDQPVKIDNQTRSLREEIDAIMLAFTEATGMKAQQGGLINSGMEQTMISLHHANSVPVRKLLDEVLDRAPMQMSYVFTYNPANGGSFGIGVQASEKWTTDQAGKTTVQPLYNPNFASTRK